MLRDFMKDKLTLVKQDGQRIENVGAAVTPGKIIIDNGKLPVEEGDTLERLLPNGLVEQYTVLDRGYFAEFHGQPAHYQIEVQKESGIPRRSNNQTIYNVTGPNARVNVQSTDTSTNVVNVAAPQLFEQLAISIREGVQAEKECERLLERVKDLESAHNGSDFLMAYQRLIAAAADHMTVLAPFLGALAQLANR